MSKSMTKSQVNVEAADVEYTKPAIKKFKKDDQIECQSITNGELLMIGKKTGYLYKWADYGDVQAVEYADLAYDAMISDSGSFSKYPRFVILDEDFVAQNKKVAEVYDSMYSRTDLKAILKLPAAQMRAKIEVLPKGAKNAIKGLASTAIQNGQLDSVATIKALDEIFDTQMLQLLTDY